MVTARLGIRHEHDAEFFYDKPRPQKRYEIRKCDRGEWAKFRRYHYLNTELASACRCFGVYDGDNIIGFMGVLHQPHGVNTRLKRVSRLVILPDYQGIGIGYKFLCAVAEMYKSQGWQFSIVTSAKNLIHKLYHSDAWQMIRVSYNRCSSVRLSIDYKRKSMRDKCKTASFKYRG